MLSKIKGITIARFGFGLTMAIGHGLPKLLSYESYVKQFPDVLGIGVAVSLILVIFAELFCALCVAFGIQVRLACLPIVITMAVACFVYHAADPFSVKELSFLFLIAFSSLMMSGGGPGSRNPLSFGQSSFTRWLFESK